MNQKIISLFVVSLFILSSCTNTTSVVQKSYKTYLTQSGNVTITDDLIATIEGNKTSSLAFRSAGIISEIYVLPGDQVKKGQLLAKLGNKESAIQTNGLLDVQKELKNLENTTNTIQSGIENLSNATSKLYDERIKGLDTNILSLKNSIEQASQNLGNKNSSLLVSFETFAHDFDRISTAMLYEGDKILGITTNFEYANDAWENYLGTRVGDSRAAANNAWNSLYSLRGDIRAYLEKGVENTDINLSIETLNKAFVGARALATSMNHMLQNSVVGGGLPEEKLTLWLTTWTRLTGEEQSSEANFVTWKNGIMSLTSKENGSGSAVADKDIVALKIQLDQLEQSKATLVAEKQAKLKEIKTNTDTVKSKESEIMVQLKQTEINTSLAIEAEEYTMIHAPYDGVILEKYLEEGMVIGAGTPLIKMSSTEGKMIKTYIDNSLYHYQNGDIISATHGNDTLTGTVSLMQNQRDSIHNKNYLEIMMSGSPIIGTKVTLHLEHKKTSSQDGIIIPLSAVITRYGPPGVYILDGDRARFQLIEILGSDMQYAEVRGLVEGYVIITEGKDNIYDGEKLGSPGI